LSGQARSPRAYGNGNRIVAVAYRGTDMIGASSVV
jgi:hypothetical protein